MLSDTKYSESVLLHDYQCLQEAILSVSAPYEDLARVVFSSIVYQRYCWDVILMIFNAIEIRDNNIQSYVKLIKRIFEDKGENVSELKNRIMSLVISKNKPIVQHIRIRFLHRLFANGIFSVPEIIQVMNMIRPTDSPLKSRFKLIFAQVLSDNLDDLLNSMPKLYVNIIESAISDNWVEFNQVLEYGCKFDSVQYALKYDDINMLQKFSANIGFDFNTEINNVLAPFYLDIDRPTYIQYSAFHGSKQCFKFLYLNNADMKKTIVGFKELQDYAIAGGDLEIIRMLESFGVLDNVEIKIACDFCHSSILEWVFSMKEIDSETLNKTLISCCQRQWLAGIISCIAQGANPNFMCSETESSPIHMCCSKGYLSLARYLMAIYNVDPNLSLKNGATPLHECAVRNNIDMVHLLLEHKDIDINKVDIDGETPIFKACLKTNNDMIRFFYKNGSNINQKNNSGQSLLEYATEHGSLSTIQTLIELGASITPETLLIAVDKEKLDIVNYLISFNVIDINCSDKEYGRTPLMFAVENQNKEIVNILLLNNGIDYERMDYKINIFCLIKESFIMQF